MKATLPVFAALLALPAAAQETRQLDAHEHGVGVLNIAAEGPVLLMELRAPGADIVGFEYQPETDADKAAVDSALATLGQPLELFAIPAAAGCTVTQAAVDLEIEGDHDDHGDHGEEHADAHGHDDHGHDEHADEAGHDDHGHDDHGEEHADAHGHDDHGHDDHAGEAKATHSEFHAEYELTCADPAAITQVAFPYFDRFENAQEIEVQVVTGTGAQAFEVERNAPTVDLTGLF